ncbi:MAG TPA: hypothetical protein VFZ59_03570 [Verrucomicrobiae bacterium]|nr:hypothetical protein [Verrucomicrobiae bacterium]
MTRPTFRAFALRPPTPIPFHLIHPVRPKILHNGLATARWLGLAALASSQWSCREFLFHTGSRVTKLSGLSFMFAMGILGLGVLLMMAVVAAIAIVVVGLFLLLLAILPGLAFIRHREKKPKP